MTTGAWFQKGCKLWYPGWPRLILQSTPLGHCRFGMHTRLCHLFESSDTDLRLSFMKEHLAVFSVMRIPAGDGYSGGAHWAPSALQHFSPSQWSAYKRDFMRFLKMQGLVDTSYPRNAPSCSPPVALVIWLVGAQPLLHCSRETEGLFGTISSVAQCYRYRRKKSHSPAAVFHSRGEESE